MRWIRQVKRVSDRIMAIDMKFERMMIRFIAVYCPHAGYAMEKIERLYLVLDGVVADAERRGFYCIIGGDFNTVYGVGMRGQLLAEFANTHGFDISNHPDRLGNGQDWDI